MERRIYYSFHDIPFGEYGHGYVKPRMGFSSREIKEILISIIVLSLAFAIAWTRGTYFLLLNFLPISFLAVVTAFACHEIAHKYAGIRYGYWSEYRMFPQGLLFALLLSFVGFVFAAPGAVMIFGVPTREESGKISMAGPMANILVAIIFMLLASSGIFYKISIFVAHINAFLAFFNLIPLGPLDGRKIFVWNIAVWTAMIFISVALMVISFMI